MRRILCDGVWGLGFGGGVGCGDVVGEGMGEVREEGTMQKGGMDWLR